MRRRDFMLVALICAFETYFLNESLLEGQYFFALFWGFLLLGNLQKAHFLDRFVRSLDIIIKKKK